MITPLYELPSAVLGLALETGTMRCGYWKFVFGTFVEHVEAVGPDGAVTVLVTGTVTRDVTVDGPEPGAVTVIVLPGPATVTVVPGAVFVTVLPGPCMVMVWTEVTVAVLGVHGAVTIAIIMLAKTFEKAQGMEMLTSDSAC